MTLKQQHSALEAAHVPYCFSRNFLDEQGFHSEWRAVETLWGIRLRRQQWRRV